MTNDLTASTARILARHGNNEPVGAGIFVSERFVLTCAHVVNDALGRAKDEKSQPEPEQEISLDFPIAALGQVVTAKVCHWRYDEGSADIAGLEITENLPANLPPIRLMQSDDLEKPQIEAFGFPAKYDRGIYVEGTTDGRPVAGRWIQIDSINPKKKFISGGFSGGPVWTANRTSVVGITVEGDKEEFAYCIPADVLTRLWPKLKIWSKPVCPYRGLFAFREEDAPFFFGREIFAAKLVEAVNKRPLVAVFGSSGSGKSSVVSAGLVPALKRSGKWCLATFRIGKDPFQNLIEALVPIYEPDRTKQIIAVQDLAGVFSEDLGNEFCKGKAIFEGIIRKIHQIEPDKKLLIIADQFEELYTLTKDPNFRRQFLDLLLIPTCTQEDKSSPDFQLILTLRADFLAQALLYPTFGAAFQEGNMLLSPMSRNEQRNAIEKPANLQRVTFEPGLVDLILKDVDVTDKPGQLPLLEFALEQLWKQGPLTHATYKAIGGVERALSLHAEEFYAKLGPGSSGDQPSPKQKAARRIFTLLVRSGEGTEDTRRVALRTELSDEEWDLVQQLAGEKARLVVTDQETNGKKTVEVVHEALIREWERLRQWVNEDRRFLTWRHRLRFFMKHKVVLRDELLTEAKAWLDERPLDLGQAEYDFIKESIKRHKLEQKQHKLEQQRNKLEQRLVAWQQLREEIQGSVLGVSAFVGQISDSIAIDRYDLALDKVIHWEYERDRLEKYLRTDRITNEEVRREIDAQHGKYIKDISDGRKECDSVLIKWNDEEDVKNSGDDFRVAFSSLDRRMNEYLLMIDLILKKCVYSLVGPVTS